MRKTTLTKQALTGVVSFFAMTIAAGMAVAQAEEVAFDIEEQSLSKALLEFNEQSGLSVAAPIHLVEGKTAPAVKGEMSPEEALEKLLSNSGLRSKPTPSGDAFTVTLVSASLGKETTPARFQVAQVAKTDDVREVVERDEEDQEARQDTIVVTGTNIRGVSPDSSPSFVFDRDDINSLGVLNTEQFFERLPQNYQSVGSDAVGTGDGFNAQSTNGIDLRGLGVGSTLVLLNGRRLALAGGTTPDISMLPLGAIGRIEVLTDGASSIYGSDAVGGVVNFVLRDEFEGAETTINYSTATRGDYNAGRFDQSLGKNWDSGNVLAVYSLYSAGPLRAEDRDFSEAASPFYLSPVEQRHSGLLTGNQDIGDRLTLFGDFLFTLRDSKNFATLAANLSNQILKNENTQYHGALGGRYNLGKGLVAEVTASYSRLENDQDFTVIRTTGATTTGLEETDTSTFEVTGKIDGPLIELGSRQVKFALGGGYREEDFARTDEPDRSRNVTFVFGELFAPFVTEEMDVPLINRLELNVSGRYADFSDFGDAFTPKYGLLWSPFAGFNLRATYAESFRAPTLNQLDEGGNFVQIFSPASFGFPDPFTTDDSSLYYLVGGGGNANLIAEEAESYTFGFDYSPEIVPELSISGTYFNIDYQERVGFGDTTNGFALLRDPFSFPDLFLQNPSPTDFEPLIGARAFDFSGLMLDVSDPVALANDVTVILDNRIRNLAISKVDGIDFSIDYQTTTTIGEFSGGAALTYILDFVEQTAPSALEIDAVDVFGSPADLRGRAYVGWSRDGWQSQLNVNYVDGYGNPFSAVQDSISSWTTIDLSSAYTFAESPGSLKNGLTVSLNVQNLLDEDPPFVRLGDATNSGLRAEIGFDPSNANALGRVVSLQVTKAW